MVGSRFLVMVSVILSLIQDSLGSQNPSRTNVLWFEVGPSSRNCRDVQQQGHSSSGVYTIFPYDCCPNRPLKVYCDMETDGGGWTVIQRRDDIQPREDFFRSWMEYALGFGKLDGEFWLGLEHIHALADQTLNQLRFDMGDFENNTRWAEYKFFYVHDRSNSFRMEVNGYSGDAGDSFSDKNGQPFSAKDKDLDKSGDSCATLYKAAWWYTACHGSNPNGFYYGGEHSSYADGVNWQKWRGYHYSLKKMEIKIRPSYDL